MSKITLGNLSSLANQATAIALINANSNVIIPAFDNTLSRDGTAPNQMEAVLDMNSNRIINLPAPLANTDAARLIDLLTLNTGLSADQVVFFTSRTLAQAHIFPINASIIFLSGWASVGDGGGGIYIKLASPPATPRNWHLQSADGAWWQLSTTAVLPKQVGAVLDGTTDDTVAIQAWVDYPTFLGGISVDQPGTASIPTGTIKVLPGLNIRGGNQLTIKRTSDITASVMEAGDATGSPTNNGPFYVEGINFTTTAGFSATPIAGTDTTHNITAISGTASPYIVSATGAPVYATGSIITLAGLTPSSLNGLYTVTSSSSGVFTATTTATGTYTSGGTAQLVTWSSGLGVVSPVQQSFTIPAGLNLTIGSGIQLTPAANTVNYQIALITSYVGTTLLVNVVTAVGSGTFTGASTWLLDNYPKGAVNNLADSNIALRFRTCNNITIKNVVVKGRFYNSIETRNCNYVTIRDCTTLGYVNRGIAAECYHSFAMHHIKILDNVLDGFLLDSSFNPTTTVFAQYAISTSATDGAAQTKIRIAGNTIANTNYQGIVVGGGTTFLGIDSNNISMVFGSTVGVGILCEFIAGGAGGGVPQHININNNVVFGGIYCIQVLSSVGIGIMGNDLSAATACGLFVTSDASHPSDYVRIASNTSTGNTADGYLLAGGFAGGVGIIALVANISASNGGWGYNSNGATDTVSVMSVGNVALFNTAGTYNTAGAITPTNGNI